MNCSGDMTRCVVPPRRSARSWGLGALIAMPLFDGGRRDAIVQQAQAQAAEADAAYRGLVLNALRQVEDQLAAIRTLQRQGEAQGRAVQAAERASALSNTRWRNGAIGQLELLDAQRTALRTQRAAVQVEAARQQAAVGLVRALGGGWRPVLA
jgi:outer membrane protein, multidrug efflux system